MSDIDAAQVSPWRYTVRALQVGGIIGVIGFLLTGCATPPTVITEIVERRIEVPKSLLTCSPEPVAGSVWVTQKDVGRYMLALAEAGEDCRTKLESVRRLIESQALTECV